ncbi:chromatin assembly factor 1 subunit A-like [Bombina bombina]|uniref:chromatin assembly factor 1 subunit A-like n=1 Tax=Bombina bombina TaxID=8345 RepID=UPI00235B17DE|nr:chromatin assembly factor 1 subunit A-like [Bombina bombina]
MVFHMMGHKGLSGVNPGFLMEEILSQLLPLLHGNANGSKVIIHEYQECCRRGLFSDGCTSTTSSGASSPCSPSSRQQTPGSNITLPSKARLKRIISENSVYEKRPDHRMCWYVHAEVLKSFEQDKLPVPCQWTYITQVNSSAKEDNSTSSSTGGTIQPTQTTPVSVKRKSAGSMSITKFMKRTKDLGMISGAAGTRQRRLRTDIFPPGSYRNPRLFCRWEVNDILWGVSASDQDLLDCRDFSG